MDTAFWIVTILFMLVSLAMVLIILVQRPSGGGLAGAFGGAGGSGSDTVFGGRVGDALTWATVTAFVLYLGFAIALNLLDNVDPAGAAGAAGAAGTTPPAITTPSGGSSNQILPGDPSDTINNDDFGGLDDSGQPPAEDPTDDSAGESTGDDTDPTTTEDPPTSPGGDN